MYLIVCGLFGFQTVFSTCHHTYWINIQEALFLFLPSSLIHMSTLDIELNY